MRKKHQKPSKNLPKYLAQVIAMERIAQLGGADGPFEMILQFVGGRMPAGATWNRIREWRALSRTISLAWMQYNRDTETVGPNAGLN